MSASASRMAAPVEANSTQRYGDFKPVVGSTGRTLFVLQKEANHPDSMRELNDANLRPLTRQEVLPLLMKDETLRNELKGKWFWLAGQGMDKDGLFTVDEKGELREITKKDKLSIEDKVRVYSGEQPLSFDVLEDYGARDYGRRFDLAAYYGPRDVAPVVVGVPKDGREATAPKGGSLTESVQAELTKVQARRTEIKDAFEKEDEQLAKREKELKEALPKAEQADKAKAQARDLVRGAEDSEKAVMATLRGGSKNA